RILIDKYTQNKTPPTLKEIWTGRTPNVDYFHIIGCKAYATIPKQKRKKLDDVSVPCVFLGYPAGQKGHIVMELKSRRIFLTHGATFDETSFPLKTDPEAKIAPLDTTPLTFPNSVAITATPIVDTHALQPIDTARDTIIITDNNDIADDTAIATDEIKQSEAAPSAVPVPVVDDDEQDMKVGPNMDETLDTLTNDNET
ncbi:hypothetical protein BVRB_035440, partial [Beta vulgaris subsp. vulgaris]